MIAVLENDKEDIKSRIKKLLSDVEMKEMVSNIFN